MQEICGYCKGSYDRVEKKGDNYRIQLGRFSKYNHALEFQIMLYQNGFNADIEDEDELYAVRFGNYNTLDKAATMELYLRFLGFNTLVYQE